MQLIDWNKQQRYLKQSILCRSRYIAIAHFTILHVHVIHRWKM